ncbi:MAG: sigma 54-interacting transcriptional regulator [Firmicutes bacterium]|nr:sigma 54-interacting transcriptional regulator [Bacillota bacterium]
MKQVYYFHDDEGQPVRTWDLADSASPLQLLEASYDGLTVFDQQGQVVASSGIPFMEQAGTFFQNLVFQVVQSGKRVSALFQEGGENFLVTASPVFNRGHEVSHVVCNVRNLEELGFLEREIQYLTLLEKGPTPSAEWTAYREELKEIITRSAAMRSVLTSALRVAQVDSTVLILGESGVGKDMLARLIHRAGKRRDRPFVKISCGAIPESLLESELFGYEGGAFTGARKEGKPGLFEQAADGTIFLDEIGELSLNLQVKLLNVLQDRNFLRVGGVKPIPTNARVIAATNRDLEAQVKEGAFRADLYYRLSVIPLVIPPLRARRGDILPLVRHFQELFCKRYGFKRRITPAALNYLIRYDWPGNVRELQNVMEFLVVMTPGEVIDVEHLPEKIVENVQGGRVSPKAPVPEKARLKEALEEYERALISRALAEHETLREAAEYLGIDLSTLTRKKQKYGLARHEG